MPVVHCAPTPVFWCEPTGKIRRSLRCYETTEVGETDEKWPCRGYCNALKFLDEVEEEFGEPIEDGRGFRKSYDAQAWPWDAFPTVCEKCGREFVKPTRQIFTDEILEAKTGPRAGEVFVRREAPVGAMWEIEHYRDIPDWCGRDGMALNVVTPGGEWSPDSRAANCTRPGDTVHRCWVRRGDPKTGYCHVDKDATIQETCEAGAGSIWQNKGGEKDFHGFLYRGFIIDADGDQMSVVNRMLDAGNPVAPAERVLTPVQADVARVRREVPVARPAARPAAHTGVRRWRSNR